MEDSLPALDLNRLPDAVWVDDTSKWPPVLAQWAICIALQELI